MPRWAVLAARSLLLGLLFSSLLCWSDDRTTPANIAAGNTDAPTARPLAQTLPPGVHRVGGGVTPPAAIYTPDPKYPKRARKAKQQGVVRLSVIIGADGKTRDIAVIKSLAQDMDQSAIAAVQEWRFHPATKNGTPVAVLVNVEVNFRLY